MNKFKFLVFPLLLGLMGLSSPAFAREVAVSYKIDHRFIENILITQVFKGKHQTLRVNDDGTGCNFLQLARPRVIDTQNDRVRVRLDTWARIGQPVGGQCLLLLDWRGKTDLYNTLQLTDKGRTLRIKVQKSVLLNQQGVSDDALDQIWQWFNTQVNPLLDQVDVDLNEPISQLQSYIPLFIPRADQASVRQLASSFAMKSLSVNPKGILLSLHFDIPDVTAATRPVKSLSKTELKALEKKLDALDGFVTFTLQRYLTVDTPLAIRRQLLERLIRLRYDIIEILEQPEKTGTDPVKRLFLQTWQDIAPLIREIGELQKPENMQLGLLTFIAANDVLYTIDEIGPALGLDVSVDGLTRLARLINDDPRVNPIELKEEAIPGFSFRARPVNADERSETRQDWLDFFIPSAWATTSLNAKALAKLNRWVPSKKDMNRYLPLVERLLAREANRELRLTNLKSKYHKIYRSLVYATAWQESCWRQFMVKKRQRWPLQSASGDIGMMQINPRVWRGFYDLHKVEWDIANNVRAGSDILMHYFLDYAIRKKEHIKTGKLINLARAAYAGYNGGPRQITRYRSPKTPKALKRIDQRFFRRFMAIYKGNTLAVKRCYR